LSGASNAWLSGENLGEGLVSGLEACGYGAAIGGVIGGFMGTDSISSTGFMAGSLSGLAAGVTNGFLTGSPYKKFAITDGENIISRDAAAAGVGQEKGMRNLKEVNDPYSIEIKAPKGWEMTDGYSIGAPENEGLYFSTKVTNNNSQVIEFPIGTPHGGSYGAQIKQPIRLLVNNGNTQLFYSNERNFSTLFWFLSLIK
jgi:hypothetical protein